MAVCIYFTLTNLINIMPKQKQVLTENV